jgi:hypothetical protein
VPPLCVRAPACTDVRRLCETFSQDRVWELWPAAPQGGLGTGTPAAFLVCESSRLATQQKDEAQRHAAQALFAALAARMQAYPLDVKVAHNLASIYSKKATPGGRLWQHVWRAKKAKGGKTGPDVWEPTSGCLTQLDMAASGWSFQFAPPARTDATVAPDATAVPADATVTQGGRRRSARARTPSEQQQPADSTVHVLVEAALPAQAPPAGASMIHGWVIEVPESTVGTSLSALLLSVGGVEKLLR